MRGPRASGFGPRVRRWLAAPLLGLALSACRTPAPPARATLRPLPADAYGSYLRGRAALYEGDPEAALVAFDQAAAAAPDEAGIAIARADALYRLDRRVAAADDISATTRRWPRSPEVWLASGRIHRGTGDVRRAVAAFERAIDLDPSLADAYLGLASTHTLGHRPDRAEAALRRLVAAVPDSAEGHHRLAELHLARNDDAGAEPHLRRVLVLVPDHVDDRLALAALLHRRGQLADGIALAREASRRSGDHLDAARDLIALLLEAGDRAGAVAILDGYGAGAPLDQQVAAAWLLVRLGELDRARATAVTAGARGADVDLLLARAALAEGDLAGARAAAERVAAEHVDGPQAQLVLAEAALAAGDLDGARARAEAILARAPDDVDALAVAAEAQRRAGRVDAARARFEDAARRDPHERALAFAWSGFEARAGRADNALTLALRVLEAQPDDPAAQNLAGYALVEARRDLPRARALLTAARAGSPGDAAVLDSWGWLLRAEGDLDGAARALDHALTLVPLDAELVVHAATIAVERGDRAGAVELLATLPTTAGPELQRAAAALRARAGAQPAPATAGASPSCLARLRASTPLPIRRVLGPALAAATCDRRR